MFENKMPRYEILSQDAMASLEAGLATPDDRGRRRVHARRRPRAFPQGRAEGRRQDGLPRSGVRARPGRQSAQGIRRPGPQPGQQRAHRRQHDGVQRRLRSPVRPRRCRTPRRDDGRLPKLHEAGAGLRGARLGRRHHLRAVRHTARLPAPRHDLRAADPDRQDLHGQCRHRRERPRHHRDGRDPVRRSRGDRGDTGLDLADQLQFTAAVGRPHVGVACSSTARPASPSC